MRCSQTQHMSLEYVFFDRYMLGVSCPVSLFVCAPLKHAKGLNVVIVLKTTAIVIIR